MLWPWCQMCRWVLNVWRNRRDFRNYLVSQFRFSLRSQIHVISWSITLVCRQNWLILKAYRSFLGYFMPKCYWITWIHFFVSLFLKIFLCTRFYQIRIIFLNRPIWLIDGTLTGNTTPSQSRPGSNDNEGVLNTLQIFKTGNSRSDSV